MATGKVVRESLDRLSIIIMGGVAAEANKYGKTEGGLDDERQLIDFFQTQVQPGTFFFHFHYRYFILSYSFPFLSSPLLSSHLISSHLMAPAGWRGHSRGRRGPPARL